jgi:hypothetical protein
MLSAHRAPKLCRPVGTRRRSNILALHFQSIAGTRNQRVQGGHQKDADQQAREQPADDHQGEWSLRVGAYTSGQRDRQQPERLTGRAGSFERSGAASSVLGRAARAALATRIAVIGSEVRVRSNQLDISDRAGGEYLGRKMYGRDAALACRDADDRPSKHRRCGIAARRWARTQRSVAAVRVTQTQLRRFELVSSLR